MRSTWSPKRTKSESALANAGRDGVNIFMACCTRCFAFDLLRRVSPRWTLERKAQSSIFLNPRTAKRPQHEHASRPTVDPILYY